MTYVITSTCIDVKDGICQKVCPVECIYEGGRMMYIQPDGMTDELLDAIAENPNVCHYLDIPLQPGDRALVVGHLEAR